MNISFIVILGLPVLYITGSLKKIVTAANISGKSFVLYFLCAAILSFLPIVNIAQNISVNISGAFLFLAPAVYLALKKKYDYKFFAICAGIALVSAAMSFLLNLYDLEYLNYIICITISFTAVFCYKEHAPVYIPVFLGVYSLFGSIMQLILSSYYTNVFFISAETTSVGIVLCLFLAYFAGKPKGRHAANSNRYKKDMLT